MSAALAIAIALRPDRTAAPSTPRLRIRPTPLEALEEAIDLVNVPKRRLEQGLDRLLRDIENFQEPERWDGMS